MFNKLRHNVMEKAKKVGNAATDAAKKAKDTVVDIATIDNVKKAGHVVADTAKKAKDAVTVDNVKKAGHSVIEAATVENVKTVATYASGVKGYKELKEAKKIKVDSDKILDYAKVSIDIAKNNTNKRIQQYAETKIIVINNTVTVFVEHLKTLKNKNKGNEYKALFSLDIKEEEIKELADLSISNANLAKGVLGSAALGVAALMGTKAAVLGGVAALATASTGTAISGLSGAAATNATLAWLGGGSLASGGGGVAAGTAVLGGITIGAMAGAALLTGGILLSAHGSKALTEATRYQADIQKAVADMKKMEVALNGIQDRIAELKGLLTQLEKRALFELSKLNDIIGEFNFKDTNHVTIFQQTGIIIKAIGEIANTPIINDDGGITEISGIVVDKMQTVLRT